MYNISIKKIFINFAIMIYTRTIKELPDVIVYLHKLEHDIQLYILGARLAQEVHDYLKKTYKPKLKENLGLEYYEHQDKYKIYVTTLYKN